MTWGLVQEEQGRSQFSILFQGTYKSSFANRDRRLTDFDLSSQPLYTNDRVSRGEARIGERGEGRRRGRLSEASKRGGERV